MTNCTQCGGTELVEAEREAIKGNADDAYARWAAEKDRADLAEAEVARLRGTLIDQTSGGERAKFSRVGHHLAESSWHVHLAGFRSREDAEAALFALKGGA